MTQGPDSCGEISSVRAFYDAKLEAADGDLSIAVAEIADLPSALNFIHGYAEALEGKNSDPHYAGQHAVAGVAHSLPRVDGPASALTSECRELWTPAFDIIKRKQELKQLGFDWGKIVDMVRQLDEAGEQILRGE